MPETMPNILNEQFYLFLSKCVNAHIQSFHKGEYIQAFNSKKKEIGIVKNGQITIYKADIDGNTFIFEKLMRDNIFSRSFIMHNEDDLFIITDEDTEIIFFDYNYLLKGCNELCPYHKMIVNQIFDLVLDYTSKINLKMDILTKKSIQEKLFTYFNYLKQKNASLSFTIPFSYKELAEYIAVDRSALMRKLTELEKQKQIKKDGRYITILNDTI